MKPIRMAVDLLWVRHKQVGGIESYIRNLLNGLSSTECCFEFWLMVSKDNVETFVKYQKDKRFHIVLCDVKSRNVEKRIIWQNIHLGKEIRKLGINVCFEPYYCKPFFGTRNIKFITTIHDLQAYHYPEYFSKGKVAWMKLSWKNAINSSEKVVAISEYVKEDIVEKYKADSNDIVVIYNPILIDKDEVCNTNILEEKYGLHQGKYFFTVSSLLPHKNLITLIRVFAEIKKRKLDIPDKLVISGIGGKSRTELDAEISSKNLEENIIFTPFIENDERNMLYKYCYAFLFPSMFEGFGMPPIEAMLLDVPVITTECTSLKEVTQGQANYVKNPLDIDEWISVISSPLKRSKIDFDKYEIRNIANQYYDLFRNVCGEQE